MHRELQEMAIFGKDVDTPHTYKAKIGQTRAPDLLTPHDKM